MDSLQLNLPLIPINIYNGLSFDDIEGRIISACTNDINNKDIYVADLLSLLFTKSHNDIVNVVKIIFTILVDKFKEKVMNNFTIDNFASEHDIVNNKMNIICDYFKQIDVKALNEVSYIKLLKFKFLNNFFVDNAIQNNIKKHICILTTSQVITLYKIAHFYQYINTLTSTEENRIDTRFVFDEKNAEIHSININNDINEEIENLTKYYSDKKEIDINEQINRVRHLISVGTDVFETELFMNIYNKKLMDRLMSHTCNYEIEKELLLSVKYYKHFKPFAKAKQMINDISESCNQNKFFKESVVIKCCSEKYQHIDTKKIDKNKINFKMLSQFAWKIDTCQNSINLAPELNIYVDIARNTYKLDYPDRYINCIYDKSVSVINMKFGEYICKIKMNLYQLNILLYLKENPNSTVYTLCVNTCIDIVIIGDILNQLIESKLICRSIGEENDLGMTLAINEQFDKYCDESELDLTRGAIDIEEWDQ